MLKYIEVGLPRLENFREQIIFHLPFGISVLLIVDRHAILLSPYNLTRTHVMVLGVEG
jgi:hypothetical protein